MVSILVCVLGIVVGSFLGCLTYRLPRKISVNKGRSYCPNCKSAIKWYDNIPLLSYLILKGKCRNCHTKISVRYPLIELTTAIVFVIIGFNILSLILASILIAIFVIDLEHQIIPDELVFAALLVFLLSNIQYLISVNLLAGFIAADLLLFLNLITKGNGMGLGDVKLALLLGTIAGINKLFPWLLFSFVSGSIVGIMLILTRHATRKTKVPFGPFLIIGLVLSYFILLW